MKRPGRNAYRVADLLLLSLRICEVDDDGMEIWLRLVGDVDRDGVTWRLKL